MVITRPHEGCRLFVLVLGERIYDSNVEVQQRQTCADYVPVGCAPKRTQRESATGRWEVVPNMQSECLSEAAHFSGRHNTDAYSITGAKVTSSTRTEAPR
jgi:hypothetical protein